LTPPLRLSPAAEARLDEIYAYTRETWRPLN
jgi:plasmid stabilization system protein ParE